MIIECVLNRKEPIIVPIGNEKYEFLPDVQGRRVAEVWIESHIESFLAVSHLYREVKDPAAPAPQSEPADDGDDLDILNMKRTDLAAELKKREVPFAVTESNETLRKKLAAACAG